MAIGTNVSVKQIEYILTLSHSEIPFSSAAAAELKWFFEVVNNKMGQGGISTFKEGMLDAAEMCGFIFEYELKIGDLVKEFKNGNAEKIESICEIIAYGFIKNIPTSSFISGKLACPASVSSKVLLKYFSNSAWDYLMMQSVAATVEG